MTDSPNTGSSSTQDTSKVADLKKEAQSSDDVTTGKDQTTHDSSSTTSDKKTATEKSTSVADDPKNKTESRGNPHGDEPNQDNANSDSKPPTDDTPNSDGFIPGTPLSKNHPDSSLKAKQEKKDAEEHDPAHHAQHTGKEGTKEHHGLMDKIKGMTHHESSTKEPQAEK